MYYFPATSHLDHKGNWYFGPIFRLGITGVIVFALIYSESVDNEGKLR